MNRTAQSLLVHRKLLAFKALLRTRGVCRSFFRQSLFGGHGRNAGIRPANVPNAARDFLEAAATLRLAPLMRQHLLGRARAAVDRLIHLA